VEDYGYALTDLGMGLAQVFFCMKIYIYIFFFSCMLQPDRPVTVPQPATGNGKEARSIYPSVVLVAACAA